MSVNRILTDKDRESLQTLIHSMFEVSPDMMNRKIYRANVQQAFILNELLKILDINNGTEFLSVGCYEDTAFEYLKALGANVAGIDPMYEYDLHTFTQAHNIKFDVVFATSVIEHVANDEEFIHDICYLLKPNGIGILTMDFKDDYKKGDPLPATDVRFYTKYDLETRLHKILVDNDCELMEEPDWSDKDNFIYQGHQYSFATYVFRKKSNV